MKIQTILDAIDNTIQGKWMMMSSLGDSMVDEITKKFISINLDELHAIRKDIQDFQDTLLSHYDSTGMKTEDPEKIITSLYGKRNDLPS